MTQRQHKHANLRSKETRIFKSDRIVVTQVCRCGASRTVEKTVDGYPFGFSAWKRA